jgi:oligoribonuclease
VPGTDLPPLVWMDLEMTGLDPEENVIIEIATLVTDGELSVIAEGPVLAVHQSEAELGKMDEWNRTHHGESGLVDRVRASTVDTAEAERRTLAFLAEHVPAGVSPLCGNSVHQDRRFLRRHMPALDAWLHYRIVDVSTLKELARRWYPAAAESFVKREAHLALDDIRESIEELRHYRRTILRPPAEVAAALAPPGPAS